MDIGNHLQLPNSGPPLLGQLDVFCVGLRAPSHNRMQSRDLAQVWPKEIVNKQVAFFSPSSKFKDAIVNMLRDRRSTMVPLLNEPDEPKIQGIIAMPLPEVGQHQLIF